MVGAVYAQSHNVYRATSETGPYTQIATGITDLMNYIDHGMPAGEYFYQVQGVIDGNPTAMSDPVSIDTSPGLVAHFEFNETSGATASDSTGSGIKGTLVGGASWTQGQSGNSVDLSGGGQYVSLPDDVTDNLSDFTIATWVRLDSLNGWSRIFDFGAGTERYMFLTPSAGGGNVRYSIASNYRHNEDTITGTAPLPTGRWVHVAVTQTGTTGRLYVDGQLVGSNTEMHLNPMQLRGTNQNWIGRSQYPDPYLNGRIDDFRIYSGALDAGAVYQLAMQTTPPTVPAAPAVLNAAAVPGESIHLSWSASNGDYYTVKRALALAGPYHTIATQLSDTTFTNTGLEAGSNYYYQVFAANHGGESLSSPVATAVALPPLPAVPINLQGRSVSATEIELSWSTSTHAESYNVHRSASNGGPYTTLATEVTSTSYTDSGLATGSTYYYVVTAVNPAGESGNSNQIASTVSDLSFWLKFDEISGTLATDSSGSNLSSTTVGGPLWSDGWFGNAVDLDGADDYVDLPDGILNGLTTASISTWVYLDSKSNWARVFDLGTGPSVSMFLTPQNGNDGNLRFAITTTGGAGEQQINTSYNFPLQTWTHVAVTWSSRGMGVLYVNGAEVGRNSSMTLDPSSLGVTTLNYIGKSQYDDPHLDGKVDDFRILNRTLSASEVMGLANAPRLLGDYNGDNVVNAADYPVWRDSLDSNVPGFSGADGDGNGRIERSDYDVWRANYGHTLPLTAVTSIAVAPAGSDSEFGFESEQIYAHADANIIAGLLLAATPPIYEQAANVATESFSRAPSATTDPTLLILTNTKFTEIDLALTEFANPPLLSGDSEEDKLEAISKP